MLALWRFATDECPGGIKTTAICVKICAAVLIGGLTTGAYYSPEAYAWFQRFGKAISSITYAMELNSVKDAAAETVQNRKIESHDRKINQVQDRLDSTEKEIVSLKSDLRYLDATTVKAGRGR